jgi:hypothetical protein
MLSGISGQAESLSTVQHLRSLKEWRVFLRLDIIKLFFMYLGTGALPFLKPNTKIKSINSNVKHTRDRVLSDCLVLPRNLLEPCPPHLELCTGIKVIYSHLRSLEVIYCLKINCEL